MELSEHIIDFEKRSTINHKSWHISLQTGWSRQVASKVQSSTCHGRYTVMEPREFPEQGLQRY
jgi:hypothetical protein